MSNQTNVATIPGSGGMVALTRKELDDIAAAAGCTINHNPESFVDRIAYDVTVKMLNKAFEHGFHVGYSEGFGK